MIDDTCGYIGRVLTMVLATIAVALSIAASSSCHFLKFENDSEEAWSELEPPFEEVHSAYVGIFNFKILNAGDEGLVTDGCTSYDGQFGSLHYEALMAAQFCAILAPAIGIMGLVVNVLDTFFFRFFCSFLIASGLFLGASAIQAGTFSIFAEPAFCFDGDQYCSVGISVYLSAASSILYFCTCLLLCCLPTPDPWCDNREQRKKDVGRKGTKVVIQPVVVDKQSSAKSNGGLVYEEDFGDEPDDDGRSAPTRKLSRISQNGDKISDDEFNFDTPTDGTKQVEYKETTLPDGTTQVDEITYHSDGTKTVKTQKYRT